MRLIQRRAQQVVHRRINNDKSFIVTCFDINNLGQQCAVICRDGTAGFKPKVKAAVLKQPRDERTIGAEIGVTSLLVIDTNTAAKIEAWHFQPLGAQPVGNI